MSSPKPPRPCAAPSLPRPSSLPARRRHRIGQDRSLFRGRRRRDRRGQAEHRPPPRNRADRALPQKASTRGSGSSRSRGTPACASSQRRRAWRAIASGEALVTVGARSALFLPYPNLGLIVVDEAHETSFKQEEGVHYHARDVAVMRGHFERCPVVLASATPAIETRQQVALGRYTEVKLPGRYGAAEMPDIEAIDLLAEQPPRGRGSTPVSSRRSTRRSSARNRHCCSSTAAATRRSPCAAPAAIASNAPISPRGWSSIASSAASPAIIAATPSRPRAPARNATARTAWSPAARASSASRTRSRRCSPTPRPPSSPRTRSGPPPRRRSSSTGWRRATSTSSSAPSW
ncbi:primosomal protein N' [Ditylenchus destructor]|uniref:Primosomal protein N n=1 Tax=Ditylenchus destructor TaxID=166010 RepID=A0AAD4MFZ5_9BILA|nr:primosomal protein N' [Ditylenchus destructor]